MRRVRTGTPWAATAAALLVGSPVLAAQPAQESGARDERRATPERLQDKPEAPQQPPVGDERTVPDYDGRDEATTAGDVLIWVPRVALSPLYLVSEFIVRRPLGWVVTTAERKKIPAKLIDFFTFGPDRQAGFVPTGLIDFGLRPSIGIYFFWNDAFAEGNKIRAHAATGGSDWFKLTLADRVEFWDDDHELGVRASFEMRPDGVFHGLGPSSTDQEGRYKATRLEAGATYDAKLWRSSEFRSFVAIRDLTFDGDVGCCGDHTVEAQVKRGIYPRPPGLRDGYTVALQGVTAELDTRHRRAPNALPEGSDHVAPPGTGIKLQIRGEHAAGLTDIPGRSALGPSRYHWVKYGGTLGGFVDLSGQQRVLGLSLIADFADPFDENSEIPFTEQVTLGGDRPLRGFLPGRLVDRSSAVALLEYQWPIWVWMDGALHYAVGNVFGEHLENFEANLLRQSFGLGLRSNSSRDHVFEILLAFGTETFEDGAAIENVRFVFGATSGF
jgi:hypothetical protein